MDSNTASVLIVGAGPTGLVLALWLTRLGITVRIIDKNAEAGKESRAVGIQAHTLELYQQLNLAQEIVEKGLIADELFLRKNGRKTFSIPLKDMGKGLSPFPFILFFAQDDHEKILIEHLRQAGVSVERNTELVNFTQNSKEVEATIKTTNGSETVKIDYLCGCDGARSTVRNQLNIQFPGGTYSQIFYVADVIAKAEVDNNGLQICVSETDFCIILPIRYKGSFRLIGIVPPEKEKNRLLSKPAAVSKVRGDAARRSGVYTPVHDDSSTASTKQFANAVGFGKKSNEHIAFEDVLPSVLRNTKLEIQSLNWFSTYHVHHRVAPQFQKERVFLVGDAAHIHSPAGAQGMNTGIGDAINLAWKIAAVINKKASTTLLESYEIERIQFAKQLVSSTDKLFQFMTNTGILGKIWRGVLFPFILPMLFHLQFIRRFFFRLTSQIKVNYRHSPLSQGESGKIKSGDRLPWVPYETTDNFAPLQSLDWQVHIYGETTSEFSNDLKKINLALHTFPYEKNAEAAGFEKNAVYLIRPDGYISYINSAQDIKKLDVFLSQTLSIHSSCP